MLLVHPPPKNADYEQEVYIVALLHMPPSSSSMCRGSGALTPPQRVTSPEHVRGGNDGTEAAEAEEHGGLVAVAAALAPPHDSQKAPSTPNGHT